MIFVLLACAAAGFLIFWLLVRPFTRPLEQRIPHGAQYRARVAPKHYGQRDSVRRMV